MKVIICGAGQVGYGIAERLAAEGNDVGVIDNSPALVQRVNDTLDARGILGHGSHPEVLEEAGARDADLLIAVTLHDEVNIVACQVARSLFDAPTTIARIRAQSYLSSSGRKLFGRENLPIDLIISPEVEVGEMVLRRLNQPGAFETIGFADDKVTLLGVYCDENCPVVDTPLRQLSELFPDLSAITVAISRSGHLFVPHSDDPLQVGDDAYLVVRSDQIPRTLKIFGHDEPKARRVVLVGGGNIGLYVAHALEERFPQMRVKIIEQRRDRAEQIAEQLKRTVVLHGDALSQELLREADVGSADTVVSLTNDDQANILTCVLAGQLGASSSMCLINSLGYTPILRSLGITAHVNPRATTVSRILQQVRRGRIRAVQSVHFGAAEVIEGIALDTAPITGKPLRELDLPDSVRVGSVVRGDTVLQPNGDLEIRNEDRVIMFALTDQIRTVESLFRVGVSFFS